jgi:hypothetical protein
METVALQVDHVERRVDLDGDVRVLCTPQAQARQEPALRERRQHRHAQSLHGTRCRGRGRLHAVVHLRQRRRRVAQQRLAGRVQVDAAAAAVEQRKAEAALDLADLLADRAVRQVQRFGGGAQVLQLRHGDEGRQEIELDAGHGRSVGQLSLPILPGFVDIRFSYSVLF